MRSCARTPFLSLLLLLSLFLYLIQTCAAKPYRIEDYPYALQRFLDLDVHHPTANFLSLVEEPQTPATTQAVQALPTISTSVSKWFPSMTVLGAAQDRDRTLPSVFLSYAPDLNRFVPFFTDGLATWGEDQVSRFLAHRVPWIQWQPGASLTLDLEWYKVDLKPMADALSKEMACAMIAYFTHVRRERLTALFPDVGTTTRRWAWVFEGQTFSVGVLSRKKQACPTEGWACDSLKLVWLDC